MSENPSEQHQDPAEPNKLDTEVDTSAQPAPAVEVSPAEPEVANGPGNPEPTRDNASER